MVAELAPIIDRQASDLDGLNTPSHPRLRSIPTGPMKIFSRPLEPIAESEPPLAPPEPAPWTASAREWEIWVAKRDTRANFVEQRDKARAYALENDLRGTF